MGLEYFVMVRPDSPGFSGALRFGKALASGEALLADVARQIQVRPLGDFFSTDPKLAALELEEAAREAGVAQALGRIPEDEQWFSPSEGLASARAVLAHVEEHPGAYPSGASAAVAELISVLEEVQRRGLDWHLELF